MPSLGLECGEVMRIYTRREWRARYQNGFRARKVGNLETWLHHSVTTQLANNASVAAEMAQVRNIEAIGQSRFKGGVSYTFLVFPSGRVYEGHGVDRVGAHTQGYNTAGAGICLVGNYERYAVTQAQVQAVADLLKHGVAKGWWKAPRLNGGHRDTKSTACPGKNAYARIGEINRLASGGVAKPSGSVKVTPVPVGKLVVDGKFGPATIRELQRVLGTTVDGVISSQVPGNKKYYPSLTVAWRGVKNPKGSLMVRALQRKLGVKVDGLLGPATNKAWQKKLGVKADGFFGQLSTKALQAKLNQGKVF